MRLEKKPTNCPDFPANDFKSLRISRCLPTVDGVCVEDEFGSGLFVNPVVGHVGQSGQDDNVDSVEQTGQSLLLEVPNGQTDVLSVGH